MNDTMKALAHMAGNMKRLDEYDLTEPEQLALFGIGDPGFTNTIELYDSLPKYVYGRQNRIQGKFLEPLVRRFVFRGTTYVVKITPARVETKDGFIDYFPGEREELIEDALRALACRGSGRYLDGLASVLFTLTEVQKELATRGHTFSREEIKMGLLISEGTGLKIETEDGEGILAGRMFANVGWSPAPGRRAGNDGNDSKLAFVRFNILVTKSINDRSFRLLNYAKSMAVENPLARRIYKHLSHRYTFASITRPYDTHLKTIIRDFGLTERSRLRDSLRYVRAAFDDLVAKDILTDYLIKPIRDKSGHLENANIRLLPSPRFVQDIINANKRALAVRPKMEPQDSPSSHQNPPSPHSPQR